MDKMDEQVLVFPACYQQHLIGLPGLVANKDEPGNWEAFVKEIAPHLRFMRRGDVEEDPTINQVIPYVVIHDGNQKILVYNRGSKGGEPRLSDKWSIGFGGHINIEDMPGCKAEADIILVAGTREVMEELEGASPETMDDTLQFLGFLFMDKTPVDAVHFGVVLSVECYQPERLKPTDEATQLVWEKPEDLTEYQLENWSTMVRDKLLLGGK